VGGRGGAPSANSGRDTWRSDRFVHSTPARIGSPAVNACNKWRRFTSRVGCATVRGGRPPLFCGCVPPLHPWAPPVRGGLDGWFSGRTPRFGRCTQSRHAPAWRPRWPHIDVDLSPTATQRIVASSLQSRLYILPYHPPGLQGLRRRQDTTAQASREVILNRILSGAAATLRRHCLSMLVGLCPMTGDSPIRLPAAPECCVSLRGGRWRVVPRLCRLGAVASWLS